MRTLILAALFAALTAALGLVKPVFLSEVPITAQSMGPMLAGALIGARAGALSQVLFLALVAAGLPLLAGGRGGLAVFASPSVGYLLAWPIAALVIGVLTARFWNRLTVWRQAVLNLGVSLAVIHVLGIVVWAAFLASGGLALTTALLTAAARDVLFLPGDVVKATLAAVLTLFVKRGYPMLMRP